MKTEMYTAESVIPDPTFDEIENVTIKLKKYISRH
jgi:hypothetical protein